MDEAKRRVLQTLQQTSETNDEWLSKRSLFTIVVAHGSLTPDEAATALRELVNDGLIEHDADGYRVADDVEPAPDLPDSADNIEG